MATKSAKKKTTKKATKKVAKKATKAKSAKAKKAPKAKPTNWESRAVSRSIEPGSTADCPHCEEPVKYRARQRDMQVICNIYEKGKWQRVEQFHEDCYKDAKKPYGKPSKGK